MTRRPPKSLQWGGSHRRPATPSSAASSRQEARGRTTAAAMAPGRPCLSPVWPDRRPYPSGDNDGEGEGNVGGDGDGSGNGHGHGQGYRNGYRNGQGYGNGYGHGHGHSHHCRYPLDLNVWKRAPVLRGTTRFEPRPDVRNIMVTGGAGFIASWVVRHLALTYPQAYNVVSFDKLDYCSSLNNTRALNDKRNFTFYHGDLTNPSEVLDCMERYDIDTVLHFAAQSHVDLSFGNSYSFTHANVYGTHVLLESAKKVRVKCFIHVSTDEVYGEVKHDDGELLETSILAPSNPYAASKAAAEMLVQSYQKSFKLPAMIVRSNNVYGPHQYPEKIIPKFACLVNRQRPVVLHGDGSPTRRYLYASDAADAFDTILHKGEVGQIYNVGSSDEISNLELSGRVLDAMGIEPDHAERMRSWIRWTRDRPFNDRRYAVDGTKLRELGWRQKMGLDEGLRVTVDWYRRFGELWWGDISHVLTPFPIVGEAGMLSDDEYAVGGEAPPEPVEDDGRQKAW